MFVKDFTFGVLLIVISLFPLSIANMFISPKDWWVMPFVCVMIWSFYTIFNIGWRIAFEGMHINDTKK